MPSRGLCSVIFVTTPSQEVSQKISQHLLKHRLVACVNAIEKVRSMYWWDGKVQSDAEELLIMKTQSSMIEDVKQNVLKLHSYNTPEVIALPITDGSSAYLSWIVDSTNHSIVSTPRLPESGKEGAKTRF